MQTSDQISNQVDEFAYSNCFEVIHLRDLSYISVGISRLIGSIAVRLVAAPSFY